MDVTGIVSMQNGESRIRGTLLARRTSNPLGDATNFLISRNVRSGNCAEVSGDPGTIGSTSVLFLSAAARLPDNACGGFAVADAMSAASAKSAKKKKAARKKSSSVAKRAATKKKPPRLKRPKRSKAAPRRKRP
jgi:hypothetical protein